MFYWALVLAYAGFIFYLSSQPYLGVPSEIILLDPMQLSLHLSEYLPLGFLLARAVSKTKNLTLNNSFFLPLFMGVGYGLTDELHQFFVPGRTASIFDAGADTLGVALGVIFWMGWRRWQRDKVSFKKRSAKL
ncbi:vanZ like family protein [archaeon BMS3Abin16]|nr:vanZ like family protein [archaeon BMS3Abin16]GBE56075.1 vanZ like family protein [archaeon BMS3Bbin16]HDY73608.1 VanZ family protein [Euryarchaeota archaeon]